MISFGVVETVRAGADLELRQKAPATHLSLGRGGEKWGPTKGDSFMRTGTILIAAAALAVGTLLGRLPILNSRSASAQPAESSVRRLSDEAAMPIALEVPDIVSSGIYKTCGAWDDWDNPVILRP
jgi:hypothetical protein